MGIERIFGGGGDGESSGWGEMLGAMAPGLGQAAGDYFARQADQNHAAHVARQNYEQQKEFAQNSIRWKVEDAVRAGIHPLVGLGASPSAGGGTHTVGESPGSSLSSNLGRMGQDVSRAINATRTAEERQLAQLQLSNAQADLDGKLIDNQIRASQLQKSTQVGPPLPSAVSPAMGQGNFYVKPAEAFASSHSNPALEAGAKNSYTFMRTDGGGLAPIYSTDAKQLTEDDLFAQTDWNVRNRLFPIFHGLTPPSPKEYPLPKGARGWKWSILGQQFVPDFSNPNQKSIDRKRFFKTHSYR